MEFPKIVLGLRTEKKTTPSMEESDDGNFFSSDSGTDNLHVTQTTPVFQFNPTQKKNKIVGFSDASSRITPLISLLEEYTIPQPFNGKFAFLPESAVSEIDTQKAILFIEGDSDTLDMDPNLYDDNVAAQINLLLFFKDKSVNLEPCVNKKLDTRVLSLIHFCLGRGKDTGISTSHYISSLEEFVKSTSVAPISMLFPDFNIPFIIERLCSCLALLFPKHPILPSVIHNFEKFSPKVRDILINLENDDSDDSSDSFFEFVKKKQIGATAPASMSTFLDTKITNPLDFMNYTPKNDTIAVSVSEPPVTATYFLDQENHDTFQAQQFSDWVIDLRTLYNKNFGIKVNNETSRSSIHQTARNQEYMSNPYIIPRESKKISPDTSSEYIISLYDLYGDYVSLLKALPSELVKENFALYYPTLHYVNSISKAAVKRGCMYPNLISNEHLGHQILLDPKEGNLNEIVSNLLKLVDKADFDRIPVDTIEKKRPMPEINAPLDIDVVSILALVSIEFIVCGRSPLTGARLSGPPTINMPEHPHAARNTRISYLYSIYATHNLPPYIAFRVGFSLSVGYSDLNPFFACDLMFELIYMMHTKLPGLARSPMLRSGVLFFAETLERTDRYYHSTLVFDNFFLSDPTDTSQSTAIANIAHRNGDTLRSLFFYTEAIKSLIAKNKWDESLYLGQIIASIYVEHGMLPLALSVLSFLLRRSYRISAPRRYNRVDVSSSGTLKIARATAALPEFCPEPSAINTILICSSFIDLLIRRRLLDTAEHTLASLERSMEGPILHTVTGYLRAKILLKRNEFGRFLSSVPNFDIRRRVHLGSSSSHISLLSGSSFDTSGAILRMLAKAHLDRGMFAPALFWSEIIIQTCPKNSLKELGGGYLLRGLALQQALQASHVIPGKFGLRGTLSDLQLKFGKYVEPERQFDARDLLSEAASSFTAARICFERVGALRKETEAILFFCDILLWHFFDPLDPALECGTVAIKKPRMETNAHLKVHGEHVHVPEYILNKDSACDEVSRLLELADKNASRIMNPLIIIYCEALLSKAYAMRRKRDPSMEYFEFSFTNLQKISSGPRFILRALRVEILKLVEHALDVLCQMLFYFDQLFINDHILIIDLREDVSSLLTNRMRNTADSASKPVIPSVDLDIDALKLKNPRLPDFSNVLISTGLVSKEQMVENNEYSFEQFFKMLNANVRLFEQQKLSEDSMHSRNRSICHHIEQSAERIQQQAPYSSIDFSYESAAKRCPALKRLVCVVKVFSKVVVYIPATGARRVTVLDASDAPMHIISLHIKEMPAALMSSSGTFSGDYFDTILGYILVDKKKAHKKLMAPEFAQAAIDAARDTLFGDLASNPLFKSGIKIAQDVMKNDPTIFDKKGQLRTTEATSEGSVIISCSRVLSHFPFELMFPDALIMRAPSFAHLILKALPAQAPPPLRCVLLRRVLPAADLRLDGFRRSVEAMRVAINSLGGCFTNAPYVNGKERTLPFPMTLFSSNKKTDFYRKRYTCADFVEIDPEYVPDKAQGGAGRLYVLTYADACEICALLERILVEQPHASFMFIPGAAVRQAMPLIEDAFLRRRKREKIAEQCPATATDTEFICALQLTLIQRLGLPIPIYTPLTK